MVDRGHIIRKHFCQNEDSEDLETQIEQFGRISLTATVLAVQLNIAAQCYEWIHATEAEARNISVVVLVFPDTRSHSQLFEFLHKTVNGTDVQIRRFATTAKSEDDNVRATSPCSSFNIHGYVEHLETRCVTQLRSEGAVKLHLLSSAEGLIYSDELAKQNRSLLLLPGIRYFTDPRCEDHGQRIVGYVGFESIALAYTTGLLMALHEATSVEELGAILRGLLPRHPLLMCDESNKEHAQEVAQLIFSGIQEAESDSINRWFVHHLLKRAFLKGEAVDFEQLSDMILRDDSAMDLVLLLIQPSLSVLRQCAHDTMAFIVRDSEFGQQTLMHAEMATLMLIIDGGHEYIEKSLRVIVGVMRHHVLDTKQYGRLNGTVGNIHRLLPYLNELAHDRNQLYISLMIYQWKFGAHRRPHMDIEVVLNNDGDGFEMLDEMLKSMQAARDFGVLV